MAQQTTGRQPRYKRILLKLSGEALMGSEDFGIDPKVLDRMALEVGQLVGIGVQVGLVIGGGNLFRGAALSAAGMDRVTGDHMGMLATVMNALAMQAALEKIGVQTRVQSALTMNAVAEVASRADIPSAAARMCTQVPAPMPSAAAEPARQPWVALRAMISSESGPGAMFRSRPEMTNKARS